MSSKFGVQVILPKYLIKATELELTRKSGSLNVMK